MNDVEKQLQELFYPTKKKKTTVTSDPDSLLKNVLIEQ